MSVFVDFVPDESRPIDVKVISGRSDDRIGETEKILNAVGFATGTSLRLLRSRQRWPEVAEARWIAMAILQSKLNFSTPRIGRVLHRDHSTVIHGLQRFLQRPDLIAKARDIVGGL